MKREFASGAAWSTAASWLEQGAAALIFLVIAQLIGVENFGIVSMAFAFLFLGEFLVRDTITEGIVERAEIEDGRLEATFVALVGFSAAIVLALALIAYLAAIVYGEPSVALLLIAVSPTVLMIGGGGVSTALLRRRLAYRALAIRTVIGVFVGGVVGVGMALNGFGAWSLVGQRLAEIGTNSVLAVAAAGWLPKRWPRRAEFLLLRGLGPTVVQLRSVTLVITQTPTVLLGMFADPRAVGLFAFALRLAEIVLTVFVKPIQGVAQSAVAALRRTTAATDQFYLDLTELAAFSGFVAFAGLALVADPLIEILLGPEWSEASEILPFLCLASSVMALTAIQEAYLLAIDRVKPLFWAATTEAVIGLMVIAFASHYGAVAAAGAVALRAAVALPMRTAATLAPEYIATARYVRTLVAPALLAVGMAVVVGSWRFAVLGRIPDPVYVLSAIVIGIMATVAMLFGFMPSTVARLRTFIRAA